MKAFAGRCKNADSGVDRIGRVGFGFGDQQKYAVEFARCP